MSVFRQRGRRTGLVVSLFAALVAAAIAAIAAGTTQAGASPNAKGPTFSDAKAFDVSKPLRELAKLPAGSNSVVVLPDKGHGGSTGRWRRSAGTASRPPRSARGVRDARAEHHHRRPRDPGELRGAQQPGQLQPLRVPRQPARSGRRRRAEPLRRDGEPRVRRLRQARATCCSGPGKIGSLWAGFAVDDCADPSGDPIVLYDQFADRWILSQFTTRRPRSTRTASRSRRPAIRPARTTATRSSPRTTRNSPAAPSSPTTPSTGSGRTRTC